MGEDNMKSTFGSMECKTDTDNRIPLSDPPYGRADHLAGPLSEAHIRSAKKTFPLSSTTMNAGKSSTSIR